VLTFHASTVGRFLMCDFKLVCKTAEKGKFNFFEKLLLLFLPFIMLLDNYFLQDALDNEHCDRTQAIFSLVFVEVSP
jgi:hypothetical protein